jgi:NAD+ synthase (glutamine-hydrolysing)
MRLLRVAAAALNTTPLDWNGNRDLVLGAIEDARAQGAAILCLPELCLSGYGCEDAFLSPAVAETAWEVLQEVVPATSGLAVSMGLPIPFRNAVFNCVCLAADGDLLGFVAKQHLAGDGLHYEPRWFKPWPRGIVAELERDGRRYPVGDLYFDCRGVRIGFEVCEDAWVANRPGSALALKGMDLILNPSASHFAFGKQEVRERFVLEGSRAFAVTYLHSNLLGNEAGRAIYDGGALIASAGKLLAAGPRFSFAGKVVTSAVVDLELTRMQQARLSSLRPDIGENPRQRVRCDFELPGAEIEAATPVRAPWELSEYPKEEELTRSIALALYDYLRKSGTRGCVVSLSGGADSAAVACLVAAMVDLGVQELGAKAFLTHLGLPAELGSDPRQITSRILTCVYQSTRNSSDITRQAAREVSAALGARHLELDVDPLVQGYVELVERAIGRSLTWEADDLTLQNIQARARAPAAWMLANLEGALLLVTSNRSEAAVGYATMDGDTAGGLSPVAGVDKAFLRRWLRWMEADGPTGLAPIPQLAAVNRQQPTAELRPPERGQTDEADLMPYDLLDAIERAAIRDKKSPLETFRLVRPRFPQYSEEELLAWLERFFTLWSRNQWKRERYAPAFHVDDENLDPKTWCRFPILSGGFRRELEALRRAVAEE